MGLSLTNCYRKTAQNEEQHDEFLLQQIKSNESGEKKLILRSNPRK